MKSVEEQNSHFSPPSFHSNRATRELFSRRTRNCIVDIPPPSSLPFPTPPQYDLMTSFVAFFIFCAKLNYGRTGGQCTSCNANTVPLHISVMRREWKTRARHPACENKLVVTNDVRPSCCISHPRRKTHVTIKQCKIVNCYEFPRLGRPPSPPPHSGTTVAVN